MNTFEEEIIVSDQHLDDLRHKNNIKYVEWVQKIAKNHWKTIASRIMKENYYWILLEHNIKYLKPAFLNDKLLIKTFIEATKDIKSSRIVKIYNKDTNELLMSSYTNWCLISSKTNKPTRIIDEIKQLFRNSKL